MFPEKQASCTADFILSFKIDSFVIARTCNMLHPRIKSNKLLEDEAVMTTNSSSAEQLSVRERMQRFNRMASETDLHIRYNDTNVPTRKRTDKVSTYFLFQLYIHMCIYICV